MGAFEATIKKEIARLARREVKKEMTSLIETVRKQKVAVRTLKKKVALLEKQCAAGGARRRRAADVAVTDADLKKARFSPLLIKKLRRRHKLTQKTLAALLGISGGAVVAWEAGKTRPRGENQKALITLRKLPASAVRGLLAEKKTVI